MASSDGAMESHIKNPQTPTGTVGSPPSIQGGPGQSSRYRGNKNESMSKENMNNKSTSPKAGDTKRKSSMMWCEVCHASFGSKCRAEHEAGRRHMEELANTMQADCTVLVSQSTSKVNTKNQLTGTKTKDTAQKSNMVRCEVCNAQLDTKCVAEHEAGRRHLDNVAYMKRANCTLLVNGPWRKLFPGHRGVIEYFSSFGRVQVNMRTGLKLVYEDRESVEALMEEYEHTLRYDGIFIRRLQPRRNLYNPRANHEEIKAKVPVLPTLSGDFDTQLTTLISHIELTEEETINLRKLTEDLEKTLQIQWPGCSAIPFGSLVTGLGIKGSDVDCFIHLNHTVHEEDAQPNYVNKAKNLLQSRGRHLFKDVFAIPKAKTPIVKLVHIPTGASCDMNFQNCLGVMNSNLISYLLTVDPRIRPALIFLKYWIKVYNLHRKGISNYALSMIFFFYLQQEPNPILPPVEFLQRDSQYDNVVNGWNCGFMYESLPNFNNENKASVLQLLEGFFRFYADLDFKKYILSPYTGKLLPRNSLDVDENVQKIFNRYMNNLKETSAKLRTNTTVCVQDPFEHAHNLLIGLSHRGTIDLQAHFQGSAAICRRAIDTNETDNLMHTLLTQKIKLSRAPKHAMSIKIKPRGAAESKLSERAAKAGSQMAKSVILDIFTKIFKCKLTAEHKKSEVEENENDQKNPQDMEEEIESFQCVVTHNIWSQRDKQANGSPATDDTKVFTLAAEEAISDGLVQDASRQCLSFQFNLSFNSDLSPRNPTISIERSDNASDKYQEFIVFLQAKLHTFYYKIIGEIFEPVSTMIFENRKFATASKETTAKHVTPAAESVIDREEFESQNRITSDTDLASTSDDIENSPEERPKSAAKHELSPISHSPPFKVQKNN